MARVYRGLLLSHKKTGTAPSVPTRMHPEILSLSKSERKRQTSHDITSTWNLKHDTNEHIYETEARPGPQRRDLWLPRGRHGGRGKRLGLAAVKHYI